MTGPGSASGCQADGFPCGLPNAPSENYKLEQSGQVATDSGICSAGTERARVREWGTSRICIEDQVVTPPIPGKVLLSVIDHVVKANRAHHLELHCGIDTRDFHVLRFG